MQRWVVVSAAAVLIAASTTAACGGNQADSVVIYTSVTQETVDAVVDGYRQEHPSTTVEVFRAPTGELSARLAAEQREGAVRADVLWLTDPLSMQQYDAQGMLRSWEPQGADMIPESFRTDTFWGTRILSLVIIAGREVDPKPRNWEDLVAVAASGGVALPDPALAGSAFAALGFFALNDSYGFDYFRRLHDSGARQVRTPGDVVTGVAEGQYAAGITLLFSARTAVDKGSPIEIIWPDDGAIALYSPIALTSDSERAGDFVEYVLSIEGQEAIAATGWQPARPDVEWTVGGPQVTIDWSPAFDHQEELLGEYRAIFGG